MGPTIEILNDLAATWSGSILRAAWQGGLAIAAAWVLVRCRPRLPPRVACWAWRLADLKLIVALLWATPLLLPLLAPVHSTGTVRGDDRRWPTDRRARPTDRGRSSSPVGEPAATDAFHRPSPASVVLALVALRRDRRGDPRGARLAHGRPGCGGPAGRSIARDVRDAAAELARVLGLRSVPELRAGPAVRRPMLVGALRPAILLPVAMLRDPRSLAAIRPVLAHELAHVRRGDLLWSGLAGLVRGLFFFHPLVWLAHREALVAREAACDALALRASGVRPSEYGRILLDIAAGGPERSPRWAATLGMAGSAGSLKRRLMAMKTNRNHPADACSPGPSPCWIAGPPGSSPGNSSPARPSLKTNPAHRPPRGQEADSPNQHSPAGSSRLGLKIAEARLQVAEAQRKVAEALLEQAEDELEQAAVIRDYRGVHQIRIALDKNGEIDHRLVDEEELHLREAEAAERAGSGKG